MIIALLTSQLKPAAFLSIENNADVTPEIIDPRIKDTLTAFLEKLTQHDPRFRVVDYTEDTATTSLGYTQIPKGDQNYPYAVSEELKIQGFPNSIINEGVKELLLYGADHMTYEQLQETMGDILVLSKDEALAFVEELKKLTP